MRTVLSRSLPFLVVSVLLTGCESDPIGAEQGTFLQAVLQSVPTTTTNPISIQHQGSATWSGGTASETHRKLTVHSRASDSSRHLYLERLASAPEGPFQPGVNTLVPRNFRAGDNDGYTAYYADFDTGNHYIAESGTWTITEVSDDGLVSGHFDFVAAYWCNAHSDRDRCFLSPKETGFATDAVRLHVTGEFRAGKVQVSWPD